MSAERSQSVRSWIGLAGILVIALALIVLVVVQATNSLAGVNSAQTSADEEQAQLDLSEFERRDAADLVTAGPVDAPVGLVVYSDYQCPFCATWNEETLPELMPYTETGQLRIEWRDINMYGADSERAARAAYAAAIQDKYWEYHNALFPGGEHLSGTELSDDALISLAGELGLDTDQFLRDMESEQTYQEVQRNQAEGDAAGVSGTPTFILGGRPLVGMQPSGLFLETLESALADAGE